MHKFTWCLHVIQWPYLCFKWDRLLSVISVHVLFRFYLWWFRVVGLSCGWCWYPVNQDRTMNTANGRIPACRTTVTITSVVSTSSWYYTPCHCHDKPQIGVAFISSVVNYDTAMVRIQDISQGCLFPTYIWLLACFGWLLNRKCYLHLVSMKWLIAIKAIAIDELLHSWNRCICQWRVSIAKAVVYVH
jgi:hypothetical protein